MEFDVRSFKLYRPTKILHLAVPFCRNGIPERTEEGERDLPGFPYHIYCREKCNDSAFYKKLTFLCCNDFDNSGHCLQHNEYMPN